MSALYASDVLWTQIGSPEIKQVLQDEGVDGQPLPPGKFMPANATDYLNQATLVTKLNAITGQTATTGGVHGLLAGIDHDRRDHPAARHDQQRPQRRAGDRHLGHQFGRQRRDRDHGQRHAGRHSAARDAPVARAPASPAP